MKHDETRPINKLQNTVFRSMLTLIIAMAVITALLSVTVNIVSEKRTMDQNLQNIALAVSKSTAVRRISDSSCDDISLQNELDILKNSLSNIDVISVIDKDNIRRYHTNPSLIGTQYDGTKPDFEANTKFYVTSDTGPSGSQRRAYAQIYDINGKTCGFVLAVMLNKNYNRIILSTISIHAVSLIVIIACALFVSTKLSGVIKKWLMGYEPDAFSAMFSIRDNILESVSEGIVAVDSENRIMFMNHSAGKILKQNAAKFTGRNISELSQKFPLKSMIEKSGTIKGVTIHPTAEADVMLDSMPVIEGDEVTGVIHLLHDRTEYTKMMEDLSGVKFIVQSMRANNHDFNNKLHVVLGLIQMGETQKACEYITNITSIRQAVIHNIMENIEDPSVAALLIGKYANAAELNIQFTLKNGSCLKRDDISVLSGDLVTMIGNLIDNAMDSMNTKNDTFKQLSVGIYTKPHVIMITVEDNGTGIKKENIERIFENGFSSKGENRGTGLYIVNQLVAKYDGVITVESEENEGSSFIIELTEEQNRNV